jgi:hypothetical protein
MSMFVTHNSWISVDIYEAHSLFCYFCYLLIVVGWMDIFGHVRKMFWALLYLLPLMDCQISRVIKSCKFFLVYSPSILKSLVDSYWVFLNFRNITYLNPSRHEHIPKPPDGVVMPKKVCICYPHLASHLRFIGFVQEKKTYGLLVHSSYFIQWMELCEC